MQRTICGSLIPHFSDLRRVPSRYRQVLPLSIMQRYQCLVVGSAPGVLTVAITDRHNTSTLQTLQALHQYTGQAIFPVLIDQGRMRLLLQRIERCDRCKSGCSSPPGRGPGNTHVYHYHCSLLRLQAHGLVMVLSGHKAGRL